MTTPADQAQRRWTYEDYLRREGRWELIDGVFYNMAPAPHPRHQQIVFRLARELATNLECEDCEVYVAPIAWRIDDHNVVQPDVAIFCQPPDRPYFDKTPPLVVEVLSPATAYKDLELKRKLYERAGVKFYLIVEPHDQFADIFENEGGRFCFSKQALYGDRLDFELGEHGKTAIDFSQIFDPPSQSTNLPA